MSREFWCHGSMMYFSSTNPQVILNKVQRNLEFLKPGGIALIQKTPQTVTGMREMEFSFVPCLTSSIVRLSTTNLWENNSLSSLNLIQEFMKVSCQWQSSESPWLRVGPLAQWTECYESLLLFLNWSFVWNDQPRFGTYYQIDLVMKDEVLHSLAWLIAINTGKIWSIHISFKEPMKQ